MNQLQTHAIGARLIIVGGAPRSGTSLTQAVLDSHPRIYGGPEFDCLPAIAEARNRMMAALAAGRIVHFCDAAGIDRHFGGMIEQLFGEVIEREGVERLSEKTPANALVFAELLQMLPGAKFIEVVRDPRAVVASMLQVAARFVAKGMQPPGMIATVASATQTVAECVHRAYSAAVQNPGRVYRLRYEDLVTSPETATRPLFEFLGMDWAESVATPGAVQHEDMDDLRQQDGGLWDNVGAIVNPFTHRLESWRNELSAEAQAYVTQAFAGSKAHIELGYRFD